MTFKPITGTNRVIYTAIPLLINIMQGNGLKIFFVVAFLLLTGYYLFPSVQNYFISRKMNSLEGEALEAYVQENYQKIQRVREESLKLGLDLQGGMHVTLEVGVDELIRELAADTDQTFEEVLAVAREQVRTSDASIIDAFVEEFERRDPNARLSRYFRNADAGITRRSTNAEIASYLNTQAEDAVNRAIEIVRQRVDRYGVTEPSIQKLGTRRISVELPGVDDAERVRRLLRGTARLEFRLMAEPEALQNSLRQIIEYFESTDDAATSETEADTTAPENAEIAQDETAETAESDTATDVSSLLGDSEQPGAANPFLEVVQPVGQGVQFGLVAEQDTGKVNRLLADPAVKALLPPGIELLYTANPVATTEDGHELYYLLGVREQIELTGDVIVDSRVDFNELNQPTVTMTMNNEGARDWARITGANINRPIAIVLDQFVYSYPNVITRIVGGRSEITGLESRNEAQDIVTILKSGAMPAPVEIVEERTVGPSLGAASIRAGLNSVLLGLLLVALFMIFYYRTAGIVADIALIVNIIFILGILAGFDATLTLPGIAGIVLTIGMAVDANVLIFERIREEQTTGRTMKAALEAGYSRAMSAIIDANITTFFVGAILYSFGVGPIQGFAVTLMAGILASLFSAIVISRVIFDYMIGERRMSVSFG